MAVVSEIQDNGDSLDSGLDVGKWISSKTYKTISTT